MSDSTVAARVAALSEKFPLPAGWRLAEPFADTARPGSLEVHLVGLHASAGGADATGSAADVDRAPCERAYFELLERVTILEALGRRGASYPALDASERSLGEVEAGAVFPDAPAGARFAFSRSNGVALGASWSAACAAALEELVERDRVLRAWFGETRPERVPLPASAATAALEPLYELVAARFPGSAADAAFEVVGVFGFPRAPDAPLIFGFGAATSREQATARAFRECVQRLGFLWGENIPDSEPELAATPGYHQELFLWPEMHGKLRAFLDGRHAELGCPLVASASAGDAPCFVDLTPGAGLGELRVAKALGGGRMPLTFGLGHPWGEGPLVGLLGVHPIA